MSDPTAATPPSAFVRTRHKRKLSNYLLDKKLQLRYVLIVTILSGIIAGALGFMIYQQRRAASLSIEKDLQALTDKDTTQSELQEQISGTLASGDHALVYKMVGVGIGLVVVLTLYLLIMTHKVAGPLFKVSMYFDKMAVGKLGKVTALRQGDMLQDFYASFQEMHEAVRKRAQDDLASMDAALETIRRSGTHPAGVSPPAIDHADYRGEARGRLEDALDGLATHLANRKAALVDFPPRA